MKVSEIVMRSAGDGSTPPRQAGFGGRRSGWAWGGQRNPWCAGIPLGDRPPAAGGPPSHMRHGCVRVRDLTRVVV